MTHFEFFSISESHAMLPSTYLLFFPMSLFLILGSVQAQSLTRYPDPFIGTANGGNTFPGAVRPWGMVSVSPHTAPGAPSGYLHGQQYFYGFGHVHLSGTGCADLGSVILAATRGKIQTDPEQYRCRFSSESASPGYYRLRLEEPRLIAEVGATSRAGITRITSLLQGEVNILIDAGRSLSLLGGGSVRILSNNEVEGFNIGGGICGESNRQRVFFAARFSHPSIEHGVWIGTQVSHDSTASATDAPVGSWFRFSTTKGMRIMIKVGISYVSIENARRNLDVELPHWDFDRVQSESDSAWSSELSRIRVEDESEADLTKFYTALYHTLLHPNIINDVNGEYRLMGQRGTGVVARNDRYSVFSLWDTYRTLHPFLTLVYPERQSAMVQTMIDMSKESGWLPKWEIASNETYLMVGDPAVSVIADSYVKGIRDFDVEYAYKAMTRPATTPGKESDPNRPGYHDQLNYGYIPFEQDTSQSWWVWGPVSTSLEYCVADWSLAQMSFALGRVSEGEEFLRRSRFYENLFDRETAFMRPRLKNGAWLTPFDPQQTEGAGSWAGSGGPGYVEGNAWNYTWFVPHDVERLIGLFGGAAAFSSKLRQCFESGNFTIDNEPDIGYPYLFTYVSGEEHRTATLVRSILGSQFGTEAGGLPGNDDCGTISAWLVFSSLGFYPVSPASEAYRLGIPLFKKAIISLSEQYYRGGTFIIELQGSRNRSQRIESIELNGAKRENYQLLHGEIVSGGSLVFRLGK